MRLAPFRRPTAVIDSTPVVFRWDLDKTYLKSEFATIRELVRIPFEKAEDKVAAPGVAALIRALRATAERRASESRVYFISASPPQIGREIKKKLELDGIRYDGILFKDQLQRILHGKFRHLREQVGFKLTELLKLRQAETPVAREYLFGDDWESDPLIYSLYADVVAGRVGGDDLGAVLEALRVDPPLIEEARRLAGEVAKAEAVRRIFINLERRTPLSRFETFGPRLVPTFNYLQTAACLYEEGVLDQSGVGEVALSLIVESSYSSERIANSLADVERRGHVGAETARQLREVLRQQEILRRTVVGRLERLLRWWRRLRSRRAAAPLTRPPAGIDYRALVNEQRQSAESSPT
jgi:hypothetical protein